MTDNSIRLTKREKTVLIAIKNGTCDGAEGIPYPEPIVRAVVKSLEEEGLVKAIVTKSGSTGRLTAKGELYLTDNPKLRNPTNWESVRSWIAIIIAAIALISQIIEQISEQVQ